MVGLAIILIIIIIMVLMYNSLINRKNQVLNSFGGMDVQLKKRYDLIPNLISSVKAYMKHEADVLNQITELRSRVLSGEATDNEKVEIKIQSRWSYYLELIKKKLIKPIFGILILLGVLYIGFYVLLFLLLFFGISYFINNLKR